MQRGSGSKHGIRALHGKCKRLWRMPSKGLVSESGRVWKTPGLALAKTSSLLERRSSRLGRSSGESACDCASCGGAIVMHAARENGCHSTQSASRRRAWLARVASGFITERTPPESAFESRSLSKPFAAYMAHTRPGATGRPGGWDFRTRATLTP